MMLFLGISVVYSGGFYCVSGNRSPELRAKRAKRRVQIKSRVKKVFNFTKPLIEAVGTAVGGPIFAVLFKTGEIAFDAKNNSKKQKNNKKEDNLQLSENQIYKQVESEIVADPDETIKITKDIAAQLSDKAKGLVFESTEKLNDFICKGIESGIDGHVGPVSAA